MISILMLSLACGPKDKPAETAVPTPTVSRQYSEKPAPLEAPDFQLPTLEKGELSNGIPVMVSNNNEVPLVYVQLVFHAGSWVSNEQNPNLARATMDMLNEGARDLDAGGISAAQRKLAAEINSSASLDGSSITLSSLKKNLEESVALFSMVALEPTFPEQDWEIMKGTYIQNLKAAQEDPARIARTALNYMMYAGTYAGTPNSVEQIEALNTAAMKEWYTQYITPQNAQIVVGGDISLEEVQPILEKYFGAWEKTDSTLPELPDETSLPSAESTAIYLIDRPNASQSVIRIGQFVNERSAENHEDLYLGNLVVGGLFISRLNMNLREDKGWTYGANSWLSYNHLPGLWTMSTSVVAEQTTNSVQEILKELRDSQGEKPITQQELDAVRGYILGTEPLNYENPNFLLSRTINIDRYNLPEDWYRNYSNRLREVSVESAQEAWNGLIEPSNLTIVIVGDTASLEQPLTELGLSIIKLDSTGKRLQ